MSSSTSNSRRIFLVIFLVSVVGMAASMGIIRAITFANDVSGDTILGRVQEARAALPRILAEPDDLVIFFGSSMTQAGFSPRQFDRQMRQQGLELKSFNFGIGGLNPLFQDYLSRRIREAFEAKGRRLELALVEFCPFQATKSRYQGAIPVIDSFLTMLATPEEILDITFEDPARGMRMFNIRYFRDSISAEMITNYYGRGFEASGPRSTLPEDEEIAARRQELGDELTQRFEQDYPDYVDREWDYQWQGGGPIAAERSAETLALLEQYFETLRTPRRMDSDRLNRISCCDIEELHFEEVLVASFIRMVENFKQFSNHVEVVLLPRNTEWINYSPESAARLAAVLERIERETGVRIRDDQLLESMTPDLFRDTTHLSRYIGDVAYTAHLAREYAPVLAARESSR